MPPCLVDLVDTAFNLKLICLGGKCAMVQGYRLEDNLLARGGQGVLFHHEGHGNWTQAWQQAPLLDDPSC